MQMHWLSWPDPDKTPAPSDGVSIAGKVSGYLDLFLANKDALHVLAQDRRPQLFERVLRPMPQVSRAQLIVVADNGKRLQWSWNAACRSRRCGPLCAPYQTPLELKNGSAIFGTAAAPETGKGARRPE